MRNQLNGKSVHQPRLHSRNLKEQFERASAKQRQDLLKYQTREIIDQIALVTTFHRQLPDFKVCHRETLKSFADE